ncbi:MAG: LysE family transporter [Hyphomicrobiales bacterium]|nr:LysE family transporter [Hyphomicrobiales bacterium]MCP5374119.1 LysE family transporter [Hyphomicrobiales bacterium]
MIDPSLYLAFCLATIVLIILPGPVVSLIIANALSHGTRAGALTIAGAQSAIALQLVVVALGLTSVMAVMAEWFEWLRWAGAAYLVWLGIQKWRSRPVLPDEIPVDTAPSLDGHRRRIFTQGFFVALTNPKLLLFLAAFFPQFMDPALPAGPQLAILCPTFLVLAALFDGSYAVLAGRARHWMRDRRRMMIGERVVGSFLIAAGAWLALARRG